jgi:putative FmdB family regulatory protein
MNGLKYDGRSSSEEFLMPIYEFHCDACDTSFDERVSMSERDQKLICPKCGSKKTGRKLSVVSVGATPGAQGGGGHVHSGSCGCGKPHGSCGLN